MKKLVALLSLSLFAFTMVPAYAAPGTTGDVTNGDQSQGWTQGPGFSEGADKWAIASSGDNGDFGTDVTLDIGGHWELIIPQLLVLDKDTPVDGKYVGSKNYSFTIRGDIPGSDKIQIQVGNYDAGFGIGTFDMKATGKTNVTLTTKFTDPESNEGSGYAYTAAQIFGTKGAGTTSDGNVLSGREFTAGSWSGTMVFDVTYQPNVVVTP